MVKRLQTCPQGSAACAATRVAGVSREVRCGVNSTFPTARSWRGPNFSELDSDLHSCRGFAGATFLPARAHGQGNVPTISLGYLEIDIQQLLFPCCVVNLEVMPLPPLSDYSSLRADPWSHAQRCLCGLSSRQALRSGCAPAAELHGAAFGPSQRRGHPRDGRALPAASSRWRGPLDSDDDGEDDKRFLQDASGFVITLMDGIVTRLRFRKVGAGLQPEMRAANRDAPIPFSNARRRLGGLGDRGER